MGRKSFLHEHKLSQITISFVFARKAKDSDEQGRN